VLSTMSLQINEWTQIRGVTEIKFALVGIANTLFGLSVIYLCKWFLQLEDILANIIGYACGLVLSFALNKAWTFQHRGALLPALLRFILVVLLAYVGNLLVVIWSINILHINSYVSQAFGIIPYAAITYVGSKCYAFSESEPWS
jgi:putative flippase GtrA